MPDSCSRITRLMPSISRCMLRKIGSMWRMIHPFARPSTGTLTSSSQDNPASW